MSCARSQARPAGSSPLTAVKSGGRVPPVAKLARDSLLGPGNKPGTAANMKDVFNPDHTHKYTAPALPLPRPPPRTAQHRPRRHLPALGPGRAAQLRPYQRPILFQPQRLPRPLGHLEHGAETRQPPVQQRARPNGPPELVSPHRRRRRHRPLPNLRRHPIQIPLTPMAHNINDPRSSVKVTAMRTAKTDGVVGFTVSVPRDLAKQLDQMTSEKGYDNRSLAVADMIRAGLVEHRQNLGNQEIAGTITLVYDHHKQHVQATLTRS